MLLAVSAAKKGKWERTLPGARRSSHKGSTLRRAAKLDVLREKALKSDMPELASAVEALKRRDAELTVAERAAPRKPKPAQKGHGYAHGDEGVDDDAADARPDACRDGQWRTSAGRCVDAQPDAPPAPAGEEEDAGAPRRATVAARTRDDAPRGTPRAPSPEFQAELAAWQKQYGWHVAERTAIDEEYLDLLKRIHEANMDKRPL